MADIFREIDEDIRRERLEKLWKRFGPYVVAAALVIVVAVAGWRAWDWYSAKRAAETGARFHAALRLADDGKAAEAEAEFAALAREAPAGYAVLARFRAASAKAQSDRAAAVAAFDAIAADPSVEQNLRDLARLRAAWLVVDTAAPADMAARVEALASSGRWRHSARELMALANLRAGNAAEARRWAEALVGDIETPAGSRGRGQLLLDLLAEPTPS